jgi:tetratricopeptide (TPR) repeat protein
MGFKNLNGSSEGEWISGALVEMLTTELTSGRQLRTIPSENVARARIELELPEAESFAGDSLDRIHTSLGAQMIVLGSYLAQSDGGNSSVRVDVRVQDTRSGELLAVMAHRGSEEELIEMVSRIGRQLRSELGVEELSDTELGELKAHQPASVTAARHYALGLERLRRFEPEAAIAPLQAVIAVEPDFALAHLALADAWSTLGYDQRERQEIEAAHQLRQQLPREQRMLIEARYHRSCYEWELAIERYQALWTFYPDELEHGLRLAECQRSAGLGSQALATVERMRSLTLSPADDPRIDLAEAQAAQLVSDHRRQREAAIRARESGAARGATSLVAEARLLEGDAQLDLGFTELATEAFARARAGFMALGDQRGSAAATVYLGTVSRFQGKPEAARDAFSSALETFERIGNRRGIGETHFSIGWLLWNQEDPAGAKLHYDKALVVFRETENRHGVAEVNNKLAIVKHQEGDLEGARALYQEALAESRAIGDRLGICSRTCNLGGILASEGKTKQAIERYQEALALSRELGDRAFQCITLQNLGMANFMLDRIDRAEEKVRESYRLSVDLGHQRITAANAYWLGDILMVTGELSESHEMLSEALRIYRKTGKPACVAYTRLQLAELAVRRDLPVAVEVHARAALAYGSAQEKVAIQSWAHALLAQAAQQRSRYSSARAAVDLALELPEQQQLDIARIGCARVLAAQGQSVAAQRLLSRVLASKPRCPALAREAHLIQAELALRSGSSEARSQLQALAKEARQAGFGDVANRAELLVAQL